MYPRRQEKIFFKKVLTRLNRFGKIAKLARKKGGGNGTLITEQCIPNGS